MKKFKEVLHQWEELTSEITRIEAMLTQLSADRKSLVKEGDPDKPALINQLAAISARRDLGAARIEQYTAQLAKIEPDLIREFNLEARSLSKRVRTFREQAIEKMVEAILPWWDGEASAHTRKKIRQGIEDMYPPRLAKLVKLHPPHAFCEAQNGPILRQALSLVAHADRVNPLIGS